MALFRKKTPRDDRWLVETIERYEGVLLRYARQKAGSEHEAQDLVQSAFLKLVQNPDVGDDLLPQWLYTVIRNQFVDARRAASLHAQKRDDVPLPEAAPSALAELMSSDDVDCLMQAIASLSKLQKQVVELRFMKELSYREISRKLKKTESHVGVVLHESLKKLRVKHEEHCGDYLDGRDI